MHRRPPQRPSLGAGLFCPGPSSLNRPHPPHSQAHRDFTAWRLIRDAFAVRERRGDPQVVPGFHCPFLPDMPSSPTPGSSTSISRNFDADIDLRRPPARHSRHSRDPFHASGRFRGFTGSLPLRPARLLAPLYGSDWNVQPSGTFTSRLSTDRSPSPLLDITTTAPSVPMMVRHRSPKSLASHGRRTTITWSCKTKKRKRTVPPGLVRREAGGLS